MDTESLTDAICNLALGTERRTTQLSSCWNLNIIFALPMIFDHLGPNCGPIAQVWKNTPPMKKPVGLGAGVRVAVAWVLAQHPWVCEHAAIAG